MTTLVKLQKVHELRVARERLAASRASVDAHDVRQETDKLASLHRTNEESQAEATARLRAAVRNAEQMRDPEGRFGSIALAMMHLQDDLARIETAIDDQTDVLAQADERAKASRVSALSAMRARVKCEKLVDREARIDAVQKDQQEEDMVADASSAIAQVRSHA